MNNNFEKLGGADESKEKSNAESMSLEDVRENLQKDLENSNNPNKEGLNCDDLQTEDLELWRKYIKYKETGHGLYRDDYMARLEQIRQQDFDNKFDDRAELINSKRFLAYLHDKEIMLFNS